MALWAYTMYGAGITPALLGALVWKRDHARGAASRSILVGMVTTLGWEITGLARATADGTAAYPFGWQTAYPALALSIATLIVVSLATPPPAQHEVELRSPTR